MFQSFFQSWNVPMFPSVSGETGLACYGHIEEWQSGWNSVNEEGAEEVAMKAVIRVMGQPWGSLEQGLTCYLLL